MSNYYQSSYYGERTVTNFGPDGRVTSTTSRYGPNQPAPPIEKVTRPSRPNPREAWSQPAPVANVGVRSADPRVSSILQEIYDKPFHVSKSLKESVEWFDRIKAELRKQNILFEDRQFPATDSSLYFSERPKVRIQWQRPQEFSRNAQFVTAGVSRFDIRQGDLGDCWLLAAMACLSLYQELFDYVVPPNQSFSTNYAGIFLFRFWQYGDWVDVVVDDRLPVSQGKLVYINSTDSSEFWSALLEKAYAKISGSYECLKGGSTSEAMEDFTGGITELFDLGGKEPSNFWDIVLRAHKRMSLMGCSIDADPNEIEAKAAMGLIKGHAYSVTGINTVMARGRNVNLIRVRNPWGDDSEWKGAWSDGSREWRDISAEDRSKLGLTFENDGEFWMTFSDFCRYFNKMEICHLSPESECPDMDLVRKKRRWEMCREDGEWRRNISAGGCRNNIATFHMNPQFRVTVVDPDEEDQDKKGTLIVGLMQKGMRSKRREGKDLLTIGYAIYELPRDRRITGLLDRSFFERTSTCAKSPSFINIREVCGRHRLTPGEYIVVPSSFNANEEALFMLRLFSETANKSVQADDVTKVIKDTDLNNKLGEMSVEESAKLRQAFINAAGPDQEIEASELRDILNYTFQKEFNFEGFSVETARSLLANVDTDKSGRLIFDEFKSLWTQLRIWKTAFKTYDLDRSGNLNSSELRSALDAVGFKVSQRVFSSIVTRYATKNGLIYFNDFILLTVRLKTVFESFKSQKKSPDGSAIIRQDDFLESVLYI